MTLQEKERLDTLNLKTIDFRDPITDYDKMYNSSQKSIDTNISQLESFLSKF